MLREGMGQASWRSFLIKCMASASNGGVCLCVVHPEVGVCVVDAKDAVLPSLMHSVCICVSMCVYGGGGEVHAGNSCTRRFRRMPP